MINYINNDKDFNPIKVGKKGTLFELFVSRIEAAKKKDETIKILVDQSIRNLEGSLRQFDVLVKSSINNFEITVAVECKEYSKPVGLEKIDAFKSNCDRIPEINKMVFVSKSGFTKQAIKAAKFYGIELINISELDSDKIFDAIAPVKFYLQKRYILLKRAVLYFNGTAKQLTNFIQNSIEFKGTSIKANLNDFCSHYVISLPGGEWNDWFKDAVKRSEPVEGAYRIKPELPMIISCEHESNKVSYFDFFFELWEENIMLNKKQTKQYVDVNSGMAKAKIMELSAKNDNGEEIVGEIIQTDGSPVLVMNINIIDGKKIVATNQTNINLSKVLKRKT